ncbi:hypothetical protein [Kordia antarctica]|nr:hypothetical protein [Kordia antarctica]
MKKRTETNIDKLKNQRRLNVEEQIAVKKNQIFSEAKYWRINGIPQPLRQIFLEKGVDIDKSIIIEYEQNFHGISTDEGIILTPHAEFFKFDVDLNSDKTELIELYSLTNISVKFEINEHKKGIGKTYGFLAMKVLRELNNE